MLIMAAIRILTNLLRQKIVINQSGLFKITVFFIALFSIAEPKKQAFMCGGLHTQKTNKQDKESFKNGRIERNFRRRVV